MADDSLNWFIAILIVIGLSSWFNGIYTYQPYHEVPAVAITPIENESSVATVLSDEVEPATVIPPTQDKSPSTTVRPKQRIS